MIEAAILAASVCMADNAYYEARGEPFIGQIAVNQVALRRANLDPEHVCAEIYRSGQFTWTSDKTRRKPHGPEWVRARQAARAARLWAEHGVGQDYTKGATHYHATHVRPSWTRCATLTVQIARHKYYKDVKPCGKGK